MPKKDPERRREYARQYYHQHKWMWKRTPEQAARRNANRRERYASDEEHKAKISEGVKRYRTAHPEVRLARELRRWGITVEQYRAAIASGCAICRRPTSNDRRRHRFHADHCHVTEQFRGFLCSSCNLGLGKFGHDPERLERAAMYLRASLGGPATDNQT